MVIKTGQKVKVKVGFPEGYGPEDEGVTYKAYHFKRDNRGEVIGVEEIDCVVTQYGLVITCDSFSPFAIVAVKSDETSVQPQEKSIIATAKEGGTITTKNPNDANIIKLSENESEEISIKADEGYEIESITVCGNTIEVTNKDVMNITVKYEDVQSANNIVNANFVAKSVAQKDEERQEEPVKLTATRAEITMPKNIAITLNKTLKITPTVTETLGVQTYQWYKDGTKLEGKTNKVLTINNVTKADAGKYILKVTTTVGTVSKETESNECNLIVRGFDATIESTDKNVNLQELEPGDEFEVSLNINNFSNIGNGLVSLMGQLEYNADILERISITGQNGWKLENSDINEENLKFITDRNNPVTEAGEMFRIKFKVKDTITENTDTTIKVKGISASGGYGTITTNDAQANVKVIIIEKPEKITSNKYVINEEDKDISRIAPGTTVAQFITNVETQNVTTEPKMVFLDSKGNELAGNSVLGTGMIVKVGKTLQYTLVVTGDIDGDVEDEVIGINDLAKLKLHLIDYEKLTGIYLKAADVDNSGELDINDVAQIKLVLLDLLEIQ